MGQDGWKHDLTIDNFSEMARELRSMGSQAHTQAAITRDHGLELAARDYDFFADVLETCLIALRTACYRLCDEPDDVPQAVRFLIEEASVRIERK